MGIPAKDATCERNFMVSSVIGARFVRYNRSGLRLEVNGTRNGFFTLARTRSASLPWKDLRATTHVVCWPFVGYICRKVEILTSKWLTT